MFIKPYASFIEKKGQSFEKKGQSFEKKGQSFEKKGQKKYEVCRSTRNVVPFPPKKELYGLINISRFYSVFHLLTESFELLRTTLYLQINK